MAGSTKDTNPLRQALVVGASGLIGPALAARLRSSPDWSTRTLSRRPTRNHEDHISVDLLDPSCPARIASRVKGVTHIFVVSRVLGEGYSIDHDANVIMLNNLMDGLALAECQSCHIQLLHGLKWYGFNLGPRSIPGREDEPPVREASYYADQRDVLISRATQAGWSWSTIRPHVVCGMSVESPSNILSCIGTFAAILKEMGEPLWFPGNDAAFNAVLTITDADLLLEGMEWAATTSACAGEDFNIVNGDCFRWCDIWPAIAELFEMECSGARDVRLTAFMDDRDALWDQIVAKHGLCAPALSAMGSWDFADATFAVAWDQVAAMNKAVSFGFSQMRETESSIIANLNGYRKAGLLP